MYIRVYICTLIVFFSNIPYILLNIICTRGVEMLNESMLLILPLLAVPLAGLMALPYLVEKTVKTQTISIPVRSTPFKK